MQGVAGFDVLAMEGAEMDGEVVNGDTDFELAPANSWPGRQKGPGSWDWFA